MMQSNATMDPNGSAVSDIDFSTTAAVRNMESTDEPGTTAMNPSTGAEYPGSMTTDGYGGSASMPDDDDDLSDDDDDLDDDDLDDDDDDDLEDDDIDDDDEI